ncbi:MAG: hypothetical protein ABSB32_01840 [Thermodesulfobacteriota bacterium]|jgi:hypothetical protein
MADPERLSRVVHRAGEIPRQQHVHPNAGQLSDAGGAAQDTHVRMDAHQDPVADPFPGKKIDKLLMELIELNY